MHIGSIIRINQGILVSIEYLGVRLGAGPLPLRAFGASLDALVERRWTLKNLNTELILAGPSHVVALNHAYMSGAASTPVRPLVWHYQSGTAGFAPFFTESDFANHDLKTLFIVPEMRLGNRMIAAPDGPPAFQGIDQSLINPEIDSFILGRLENVLRGVRAANPSCRFIYWSLAGRERANIAKGNYVTEGGYRHPTWNLSDVEGITGDATVSLREVIGHPLSGALYIDDGNHPSVLGVELLTRIVDDPETPAMDHFRTLLSETQRPVFYSKEPLAISGGSAWLSTLRDHADRGLLRVDSSVSYWPRERVNELAGKQEWPRVVYFSKIREFSASDAPGAQTLSRMVDDFAAQGTRLQVAFWDRDAMLAAPADFPYANPVVNCDPLDLKALFRADALIDTSFVAVNEIEKVSAFPQPTQLGMIALHRRVGGSVRFEDWPVS